MQIIQTRSDPRDLCVSFQERHQALAEPQLSRHVLLARAPIFFRYKYILYGAQSAGIDWDGLEELKVKS